MDKSNTGRVLGNSIQRRPIRGILALLCATLAPCVFAVPPWSKASLDAAEEFLHLNTHDAAPDIHQADAFPDGARGFYVDTLPPLRAYLPGTDQSAEDQMLGQSFCDAQLMVLAEARDSVATLTRRNASILTRTEFEIIDVVRSRPGLKSGQRVSVVRLGGEVVDKGLKLRVAEERVPAFTQGQTYFLALVRPDRPAASDFFMRGDPVPVRAGHIEPASGRWEKFHSGEAYATMRREMLRVARIRRCAGQ